MEILSAQQQYGDMFDSSSVVFIDVYWVESSSEGEQRHFEQAGVEMNEMND